MRKLSLLAIIGGAALLTGLPSHFNGPKKACRCPSTVLKPE